MERIRVEGSAILSEMPAIVPALTIGRATASKSLAPVAVALVSAVLGR
jgi:hypothetical protein